jgi:hypothetical protein
MTVPVARSGTDSYIALVHLRADGVTIDSLPHKGTVAYADAAWGKEDVVAFVGPAPVDETDYNSVMTWRRDATDWSGPAIVSRSGVRMAHYARIARTADTHLHLVWTQELGGKEEALRHVSSNDGGRSWSAHADTKGDGAAPYELWAFGNKVGVLTETWDKYGPAHVYVTCWDAAGWQPPREILPGAAIHGVRMVGGAGGTLALGRKRVSVSPTRYENVLIRVPHD